MKQTPKTKEVIKLLLIVINRIRNGEGYAELGPRILEILDPERVLYHEPGA
jgi:hypothetical protein